MERQTILDACLQAGVVVKHGDGYAVIQDGDKKYKAVVILSQNTGTPTNTTRSFVNRLIERINKGLDPLKDNRGGIRKGQGRRPYKKTE